MKQNFFGNRLNDLFEAVGYRREDLAKYLGVTVPVVRRWENSVSYPDVNQFRKMTAFFNLPYDWFLDGPGDLPETWAMADRLGLSEGTVEQLIDMAQTQPGEVLDALDEAVSSLVSALATGQEYAE